MGAAGRQATPQRRTAAAVAQPEPPCWTPAQTQQAELDWSGICLPPSTHLKATENTRAMNVRIRRPNEGSCSENTAMQGRTSSAVLRVDGQAGAWRGRHQAAGGRPCKRTASQGSSMDAKQQRRRASPLGPSSCPAPDDAAQHGVKQKEHEELQGSMCACGGMQWVGARGGAASQPVLSSEKKHSHCFPSTHRHTHPPCSSAGPRSSASSCAHRQAAGFGRHTGVSRGVAAVGRGHPASP